MERAYPEFPMIGNYPQPLSQDAAFFAAANQPNSTLWTVGNQPSAAAGFIPTAVNHSNSNDFSGTGNNIALMNGRYTDALLESEFARLSLMPTVRPPAPPYPYDSDIRSSSTRSYSFNDANGGGASFALPPRPPQLREIDIQRMRIQSAARGKMYMQPQINPDLDSFDEFYMNGSLNGVPTYDMPNSHNSWRNHTPSLPPPSQSFRNGIDSPYDFGLENSSRNNNSSSSNSNLSAYKSSLNSDRIQTNNSNSTNFAADWRTQRPRQRAGLTTSLKELRGKIFSVATDQRGCRFLQSKFEEGKAEEIEMIFMEVKDHICELMVDQFGNYLVHKFLAACNQEQMTQLIFTLISDERRFMDICVDAHGSRSVQKLLEFLTTAEQRARVLPVLERITLPLTKSLNGHHIIQYFLKFYSVEEDKKKILNVVADHCMDIATDKSGCCVLQQCVEHAVGEPRHRLISEIISNALMLSEHPYGNYVVQYIVGLKIPHVTTAIIENLSGNIVSLSMSKYGSNVVEKFLKDADINPQDDAHTFPIINELISSKLFLRVLQDPFGNYVAQSAFAASKGALRSAMISFIQGNTMHLHSHPHGKRVLQCIKGSKINRT